MHIIWVINNRPVGGHTSETQSNLTSNNNKAYLKHSIHEMKIQKQ
jgi:hypothetical protein